METKEITKLDHYHKSVTSQWTLLRNTICNTLYFENDDPTRAMHQTKESIVAKVWAF